MGFAASLRARLTLVLVLVNLVVLGALAIWSAQDDEQQALSRLRQKNLLERSLRESLSRLQMDDSADLAGMLRSSLWREFDEAIVIDQRRVEFGDSWEPGGAYFNPLGSRRRASDLPLDRILEAVRLAVDSGETQYVAGGLTMPILTRSADRRELDLWGGVFVRPKIPPEVSPLAMRVLLFAVAATVLGAALIYLLVGSTVLRPVERLAVSAQEFGAGRWPELPPAGGAREVDELVRSFDGMMQRIRGFQRELESEVEAATERASLAERRAGRQERLAAMGTLAAGLAHEINSPLAGALQGLEVLRKEAHSDRASRYGGLVEEALRRIATLVQRLLRLAPARVESGRCAVAEAMRDLPDFLASRLQRHELVLNLPGKDLQVAAAVGDLFPVLLNLVQNALDALDEVPGKRGRVEIHAQRLSPGLVRLQVLDDGPGVAPDLLPHLFEPFVTTKEVGQGTGLGLALAHATVRQLGGRIEACHRPEGGLEVRLDLPEAAGETA